MFYGFMMELTGILASCCDPEVQEATPIFQHPKNDNPEDDRTKFINKKFENP